MGRPDGGWISGYTAPTSLAARGIWSLRDAYAAQRSIAWPLGVAASTQLLLHFNGANNSTTFTDSSGAARTVTRVGSPVISTAASKFGGASGSFPGSGSYLTVADANSIELGSGALAMEMWINTTSSTQYATLISRTPSSFASGMWSLMINFSSSTAGDIAFFAGDINGGLSPVVSGGSGLRDGQWHHVALARRGSSWSLYVDGTRVSTATISATIANIVGDINIARDQFYGRAFAGNIDELRILIGSDGGLNGTTITVPTQEY